MGIVISAIAGLVFGLGLIISGMANPAKVQNFLDLFGTWDPSLAFVMAGAIAWLCTIAGRRLPVPALPARWGYYVVYPAHPRLRPAAQAFVDWLLDSVRG